MPAGMKRMTFTIPMEMEKDLDFMKKEIFYSHTKSYMLRELITLGIQVIREEEEKYGDTNRIEE